MGVAEAHVRRGQAAPDFGVVHDVVVNQEVGVEQLRGKGQGEGFLLAGAAEGAIGEVDQGRAQALAAVSGELADAVDQLQHLGRLAGRRLLAPRLQPGGQAALQHGPETGEEIMETVRHRRWPVGRERLCG